jgi:glycosyltransferase involved in cell wall biosynthesis
MSEAISAVLITFNEEADIARAVDSVSWCDEVLVVDSGSTDRTLEICASRGCRIIHHEFRGFGDQKAFAVRQAAHDWVLVVDADEEVTPGLRDEIRKKLEAPRGCYGYRIPITTVLWDKVIRTQDRHTATKLRLFDRRRGNFQRQLVHESVVLDGPTELLQERMYNHSYANISDYFDKFNRYTTAAAQQCLAEGKRNSVAMAVARLPLTFLHFYLVKGFFRDGTTGAEWSLFSAFYPAVKYLKLSELRRTRTQQCLELPAGVAGQNEPAPPIYLVAVTPSTESEIAVHPISSAMNAHGAKHIPLFVRATSACAAALALLWIPLFGKSFPGDYPACLLFAVLVAALIWGYRAALLTTGLSLLALDYFIVEPANDFGLPSAEESFRLVLFLALALLTISIVYGLRRRHAR